MNIKSPLEEAALKEYFRMREQERLEQGAEFEGGKREEAKGGQRK